MPGGFCFDMCCGGETVPVCGGMHDIPTTLNFSDSCLGTSGTGTYDAANDWWIGSVTYDWSPGADVNCDQSCSPVTVTVTYKMWFESSTPGECHINMTVGSTIDPDTLCPAASGEAGESDIDATSTWTDPPAFSATANPGVGGGAFHVNQLYCDCSGLTPALAVTWSQ